MIHSINVGIRSQPVFLDLNSNIRQFRKASDLILSLVQAIDNSGFKL
jgi:hypothetical protein